MELTSRSRSSRSIGVVDCDGRARLGDSATRLSHSAARESRSQDAAGESCVNSACCKSAGSDGATCSNSRDGARKRCCGGALSHGCRWKSDLMGLARDRDENCERAYQSKRRR
jgi:hypothetical protein